MDDRIYDLADLFKVFSDSTRIRILYVLMDGEKNVSDISEAVEMNQSAVSHQLKTLKTSHLVKVRRDGKAMLYSLADDHVETILKIGMEHISEED
ncbi:MAG: winged helix-turn-helix transcriptional regulator [Lachnospiraceae bacterium]|nr:winged helix-turn-helix transcriptional regulator [Lachnospiraceae bacterium]MCR4678362.1 metalloregulator ArsR/SmtB family transcription factor [Lachnospiraceae bacterium]